MFTHLHTHSCYSFLEGLPRPEDLARAAVENGMAALALTDHISLTGVLPFYRACKNSGVRPILGLEIDLQLPYQLSGAPTPGNTGVLVLLAMNSDGWRSLCRLSSILLNRPAGQTSLCDIEILAANASGLICLTGGCRGVPQRMAHQSGRLPEVTALLHTLADIFPGRLYLELSDQAPGDGAANDSLVTLAAQAGIPVAASHNIYSIDPMQRDLLRTLAAIRTITPRDKLASQSDAPPESHFRSTAEMCRRFAHLPDALQAVEEIASRCQVELELDLPRFPRISLPEGESAIEVLRRRSEEGARRLYGGLTPAIQARLDMELTNIAARGYEPIFLIAEEMIAFARKSGIPSASRGSASSSLVAHCIGMTTPDPLSLDLYFERFLNPARAVPPDIDTDFCSRRRDEVIQHLFDTYGADQVAMVGTINTFRRRSALSEVAKAHGFKSQEIRALVAGIPHRYFGPQAAAEEAPGNGPFAELQARYRSSPRHALVFSEAEALLGLPHHLSVHPGGVVIAPGPMVDFVPTARSGGKGVTITQFDLDDVERIGLVKLDLLGIRGLTVLGDVTARIHSWSRKQYATPHHVLDTIPLEDAETSALIMAGRTIGCFQIESPGMRATLKEIQACCVPDLIAALALYRPGPIKGGLRDAFVRRHNRQEAVTHLHPALSTLLQETYGVILYQEQVLRIAHDLAGFSFGEADLLRRAMSHFDPGKQMLVLQEKFVQGALERSGISPEIGERVWQMMAAFAGYGFPKAHAASYADVAWRAAWCKAHYPAEFLAAVLANWGGYYPQSVYINEARRAGFAVRPPHVNHSASQFTVTYPGGDPVMYMGLDQVRDLTHHTQARIQRLRPFHSLTDFLLRVDPRPQEALNLIHVGAFDGLGSIPDLLQGLRSDQPLPGQLTLFDMRESSGADWTIEQKVTAQQRLLGVSLEAHPMELAAEAIKDTGALNTIEAALHVGEKVRVAGMRQTWRRSLTSRGDWMGFLTLEDLEGMIDVIFFPDAYRRSRSALAESSAILVVEGTVERDMASGELLLHAENAWRVL